MNCAIFPSDPSSLLGSFQIWPALNESMSSSWWSRWLFVQDYNLYRFVRAEDKAESQMLIFRWPRFIFLISRLCVYVYRGPGRLEVYLPEAFDCISLTLCPSHLQWFTSFCNYSSISHSHPHPATSGWPRICQYPTWYF